MLVAGQELDLVTSFLLALVPIGATLAKLEGRIEGHGGIRLEIWELTYSLHTGFGGPCGVDLLEGIGREQAGRWVCADQLFQDERNG
jgi:hypothetical protein